MNKNATTWIAIKDAPPSRTAGVVLVFGGYWQGKWRPSRRLYKGDIPYIGDNAPAVRATHYIPDPQMPPPPPAGSAA